MKQQKVADLKIYIGDHGYVPRVTKHTVDRDYLSNRLCIEKRVSNRSNSLLVLDRIPIRETRPISFYFNSLLTRAQLKTAIFLSQLLFYLRLPDERADAVRCAKFESLLEDGLPGARQQHHRHAVEESDARQYG